MDRFNLEAVEEAFGTGIIIAVAFGAHAARKLMPGKQRLVTRGTVLTTSIRMDYHAFGHFAFP